MQKSVKSQSKKAKRIQIRKQQFSLYSQIIRFYVEDLISLAKCFKRSFNLSIFLILLKQLEQLTVIFTPTIGQNISNIESYLSFIDTYSIQKFLLNNKDTCLYFKFIILGFNALILLYLFLKFIISTIKVQNQHRNLKLFNFIAQKEKNKKEKSKSFNELIFSIIFQTYNYIILIPSLVFSSMNLDNISAANIALTITIALLISTNEYDYMITSNDALRQKYFDLQIFLNIFEIVTYILTIITDSNQSMILLEVYFILDLARLIIYQPFFDRKILQFYTFLNIYFLFVVIFLYIVCVTQKKSDHLFSIIIIILLPLSYKISDQIELVLKHRSYNMFQESINENKGVQPDVLNYVVRNVLLSSEDMPQKLKNQEEIKNISFIIKYYEIKISLQVREMEQILYQQNQSYKQELVIEDEHLTLMNGYEADTKVFEGKDYIVKEQVFGENSELKRVINLFFNDLFNQLKNKKEFGMLDVYYLVFIVEILQNYQLFELTVVQMQKNINIKYQQILNSIMIEVEKRKITMQLENDENQIFGQSYFEALIYDELILSTQGILEEAVQKKVGLLLFMKQKYINLEDLQKTLEELLKLREELVESISLMIRVNEFSNELYDIYLNYLETLAFSENDIKLDKYNRFNSNQQQIFFELNSQESCILFASIKNEKDIKITKISNNLLNFMGYQKDDIVGKNIEQIMPQPYSETHKNYVSNFFERGNSMSNLKNQLLFCVTQLNHIIPIQLDIKVNMIHQDKEFGITGYVKKQINPLQYILIDASNSRLVSMTQEINLFCFPQIQNFNKVQMTSYFPFIQHFRQIFANNSSNPLSRTSQYTFNSAKSKQIASNLSIRSIVSDNKTAKAKKNETISARPQEKELVKQNKIKEIANRNSVMNKNQPNKKESKQSTRNKFGIQLSSNKYHNDLAEMYEESDDRRYRNIQFLLVVSAQSNMLQTKSKSVQGINDYMFFTMILNVHTVPSEGLEHLKYIEISQIKQIIPLYSSKFILQVYNDEIEGYLTNIHNLRNADVQCIISELEIKGFKDSTRRQDIQNIVEEQYSDRLLNSKHENEEILFNRYEQEKNKAKLLNSANWSEQDQMAKKFESNLEEQQFNQDISFKQKSNLSFVDNAIHIIKESKEEGQNIQENQHKLPQKRKSEFITVQKVQHNNTQANNEKELDNKEKQYGIDSSQYQFIKQGSEGIQQSFAVFQKQNQNNQELSDSFFQSPIINQHPALIPQYSQDPNLDNSASVMKVQEAFDSQIIPYPLTPESTAQGHTYNLKQHAKLFKFNGQEQNSNLDISKKQNDVAQFFSSKGEFFSPKDLSSQHILMNRSTTLMSPQNNNLLNSKQLGQFVTIDRDMNSQSFKVQQMGNNLFKSQNFYAKRQNTQSIHSLSKKRKKIQIAQKKEIKNLKEALETSSNHSRESTQSSNRQTTKTIILQKYTLNIMKIVNLVGISSFLIIIVVVLQQYLAMNSSFSSFNLDLNILNWAPKYQVSIYQIRKYYNLNTLNNMKLFQFSSDPNIFSTFGNFARTNLINYVIDVNNLLLLLENQDPERQLVQNLLNTNYIFKQPSVVDRTIPLNQQPSNQLFNNVNMTVTLYTGSLRVYAFLFRYSRGLGSGTSQWAVVNNAEQIITGMLQATQICQNYSINQLDSIGNNVNNVLIIICIVSALCIFIIIPVYAFIQLKREQIISLFGTFNTQYIDISIKEISKFYSQNNNIKSLNFQGQNHENQKRQNLSSTSRINRINNKIITLAFFVFCLTLPYPILNKVLSNRYITQNQESLPMISQLYTVQSFVLQQLATSLFALNYKNTPNSPYKLSTYISTYQQNFQKMSSIQVDFQNAYTNFMNVQMFDQDSFQNFFLKIFSSDICQISQQYPIYFQIQNATFTTQGCPTVFNGVLKQGLQIAIKTYFQVYTELFPAIIDFNVTSTNQKFAQFQNNYDLQDYLNLQQYIVDVLETQSQYLFQQSLLHRNFLDKVLIGLLFYQIVMMCCIFYFGWILFYQTMDQYLHKTKLYLALLNDSRFFQPPQKK
ncbi:hypothetical protein ABPG72_003322 [Tetrahymena utriculariae]